MVVSPFSYSICLACHKKKMKGEEKYIGLLIFTTAYKLMHPRIQLQDLRYEYNSLLNPTQIEALNLSETEQFK